MKKLLLFLLITIGFSLQHSLMANEPDSAYVFAYATDKNAGRNGLHFAWSTDWNTWHSIGPERTFLRSEYASGRHGKRMLSPYLIKGNDGMWHCLWSVHEGYAVFAHCASTDLISWGQQAFPTTGNTGNCMNPSVTFSPTGQDYLITWKNLQLPHERFPYLQYSTSGKCRRPPPTTGHNQRNHRKRNPPPCGMERSGSTHTSRQNGKVQSHPKCGTTGHQPRSFQRYHHSERNATPRRKQENQRYAHRSFL